MRPKERLGLLSHVGGIAFAAFTVFQSKLQARTSNYKSDNVSRALLCEVPPLNCNNKAKVEVIK